MVAVKKVLITGGLGYLGSVLGQYLLERDIGCTILDTGFFKDELFFSPQRNIKTVLKDIRFIEESDIEKFDTIIHLAAISNDPLNKLTAEKVYNPVRQYTKRLAQLCKKLGIRFIFPSSCSVYGVGSEGLLTETSATLPQTGYSLNKLQIEQDLQLLSDESFSPIALRFSTVFGLSPRMRFDLVINMFVGMAFTAGKLRLNSDGQAWRPHIYIEDVCEAFYRSILWDSQGEGLVILNVGRNDNNLQVIEVANLIKKLVPNIKIEFLTDEKKSLEDLVVDRKIQEGKDIRTYKVSFDKIYNILPGFKAAWPVECAIEDMIKKAKGFSLNKEVFKKVGFYRLQKLEELHRNARINDELLWIS